MSWRVEWLEEAAKDMRKLGKAEQKQVLKGIAKVSENPLPSSQGGYGKPLRNANRAHLAGLCKIKFRDLGIRVVYKPVLKEGTMVIIVVGVRTDGEAYENSRDYDCCQIIEEDYTVGDAVYEAYCDGRKVPVTDVEIEAAAKYLKANPGLFGPSACFIDPNRFEEIARSVLQAARNAVGKDME